MSSGRYGTTYLDRYDKAITQFPQMFTATEEGAESSLGKEKMNGQLVYSDGRIWTVHRPKTGGIVLRRRNAFRWISPSELSMLESSGLEDLRSENGILKPMEVSA